MTEQNIVRTILRDLGVGDFNITGVVQIMFMAPAQTDPAMASVQLLTRALQKNMAQMGATWIVVNGTIDHETMLCLRALLGPQWNDVTWFEICKLLLAAKARGKTFKRAYGVGEAAVELSGIGLGLPDVPGGMFTYALGGFLLYRYLKKRGHV